MKSYYASKFPVTWLKAYKTCRDFNMDLVELPTKAEADYFLTLCAQELGNFWESYWHIGGSYNGAEMNEFYWMTTEQRINYSLDFTPDNRGGAENYLSVQNHQGSFIFNDISITEKHRHICQYIPKSGSKSFRNISVSLLYEYGLNFKVIKIVIF